MTDMIANVMPMAPVNPGAFSGIGSGSTTQAQAQQDLQVQQAKLQAELQAKVLKLEADLALEREKNQAKLDMERIKS